MTDEISSNIYRYFDKPEELDGFEQSAFIIPEIAYDYCLTVYRRNDDTDPDQRAIDCIASNAYWSYMFADQIIEAPFPQGEPAIARKAMYSMRYAKHVLHDRFKLGEPIIKKAGGVVKKDYEKEFGVTL